jgi:hypothetical protein
VRILGAVGAHLGRVAAADLAQRVRDGPGHDKQAWADRKRSVTAESTARWAGSITKATHDQWALARRAQVAHLRSLREAMDMIEHRLADTGSGDGRHRPDHTSVMWPSIGPARPDQAPPDARGPATPTPAHRDDRCVRSGRRKRATRRPNTVRGRPLSRHHFRSVSRNGRNESCLN